jgi:hypothetical protein
MPAATFCSEKRLSRSVAYPILLSQSRRCARWTLPRGYPKDWERHLRDVGVSASAELPPAELDRIMERVYWLVRQTGIKDPAAWIATDMARVEAALASVEPEAPVPILRPRLASAPLASAPDQSPAAAQPGRLSPPTCLNWLTLNMVFHKIVGTID